MVMVESWRWDAFRIGLHIRRLRVADQLAQGRHDLRSAFLASFFLVQ